MPKDIRSFFASAGPAKKRPPEDAPKDAPAQKKSKVADAATSATPVKAAKPAAASQKKSPAAKRGTPARAAKSAAAKKKRPVILDSDEESGPESEASWKNGEESSDDGDIEIDLVSSDDEPAPKKVSRAGGKAASVTSAKSRPAAPAASPPQKKAAVGGRALPKSMASPAKLAPKPEVSAPKPKAAPKPRAPSSGTKAKGKGKKDSYAELSDVARAAAEAVDAAVKKLPAEDQLSYTEMQGDAGGFGQRPPDEPPNAGSKEAPKGHPDCLTAKTFVLTGVGDSLTREETEDIVKQHGGRITGSVSGKTTFLVVGTQCGRSKIAKAKEHETKLIDEDGLFSLINASAHLASAAPSAPAAAPSAPAAPQSQSHATAVLNAPPQASRAAVPSARAGPSASGATQPSAAAAAAAARRVGGASDGDLWVTKHKPQNSKELVGNNTLIVTLRQWLSTWDAVHIRGEAPVDAKSKQKTKDMGRKAVLISGPPGIGKSSSAMIITRELGFLPVEVNASDTRNKSSAKVKEGVGGKLSNAIKELATNSAIGNGADGRPKRTVLIMDEVDGMSAGDRGGVADLIQTIHKSKIPIIAICNDKYNQKLRSLRNHCMELEYRRPLAQQIVARMSHVARQEGLAINESTMKALVDSANGDLRLLLGQLQMIRLRTAALGYDDIRKHTSNAKDAEMSPFEAARKLLDGESAKLSLSARSDLVFQDMDLVPLLLQENYLNHRPNASGNELQQMMVMAKAADALSVGDTVTRRVRQYQNWTLMPFAAVIGSVYPATYVRGPRFAFGLFPGEMNFPRFSAWFGANSSSGKQRRLLGELHTRMVASSNFNSDRATLRLQYAPTLRYALTKPLVEQQDEGIPQVIEAMHDYCMSRDDLDYVLDVTKFKTKGSWEDDPMKGVPTSVKSAFTRTFNKQKVQPRTNIMVEEFKARAAKGAAKKPSKRVNFTPADTDGALRESEEEAAEQQAAAQAEEDVEHDEEDADDPEALSKRMKGTGIAFSAKGGGAKAGRGRGRGSGGSSAGGRGRGRVRGKK